MNARQTLLHAYESLARHPHAWPAKARMCAMVTIWNARNQVQEEENMPGKPWPHDTQEKLHDSGYRYEDSGPCADPSCKTIVYWFITPKGKWMPMEMIPAANPLEGDHQMHYQPHFVSCPGARNFSRKGKNKIVARTS